MRGKRRFLAFLLTLCMLTGLAASPAAASFSDMPDENDWSYAALDAAVENGLLRGVGDNILPEGEVSRAQLAAILGRAFGAVAGADLSDYTDVETDAWYYDDMAKAVAMGALAGSGNTLRPNDPVTRQETFVALARALKLPAGDAAALNSYSDGTLVADWAVSGTSAMVDSGYIQGSGKTLNPQGTITRAELAQVLYRLFPTYVNAAGTCTVVKAGNVMVNRPGVTLKDLTVTGDLILGDGVGTGDATLDGVAVSGRTIIRGGGVNSILVKGNSNLGVVIIDNPSGPVALKVQGKTAIGTITICSDGVALSGIPKGTAVTVENNVSGATLEGKVLSAGETVAGKSTATGGGGSSTTSASARTVSSAKDFYAAVSAPDCNKIIVDGDIALYEEGIVLTKPLTINAGRSLTVSNGMTFTGSILTNQGTLNINSFLLLGGSEAGQAARLVNTGSIFVDHGAEAEFFAGCKVDGTGTLTLADEVDGDPETGEGYEAPGILTLTDQGLYGSLLLWKTDDVPESYLPLARHAILVNTQELLLSSMALRSDPEDGESAPYYSLVYFSGNTSIIMGEDLTLVPGQSMIIQNGSSITVPAEYELSIPEGAELRIEGTLDVSAAKKAENSGFYFLASIGTLIGEITGSGSHVANYTVKTQSDWDKAAGDVSCEFIKVDAGEIPIAMAEETISLPRLDFISGTLNIPEKAAVTATNYWFVAPGATLANAGELKLADVDLGGTLNNSGTLQFTAYSGLTGELNNSGSLTVGNDANLELHGAALNNTSEGAITREGRFWMENSVFSSDAALNGLDEVEVSDLFVGENEPSAVPEGVSLAYYDARIGDQAGLERFQTAQLPVEEAGGHLVDDVTIRSSVTLKRYLEVRGDWAEEDKQNITPHTLTVAPGATLTIDPDAELNVGGYGTLEVRGVVSCRGRLSVNCWEDENNEYMQEQPGLILVNGTLTNFGDLNINGGKLDFQTGSIINAKDAYWGIRRGGVLTVASNHTITNHGYMEAIDTYDTEGLLMGEKVQVPHWEFYVNDRDEETGEDLSWYNQGAEVWSGSDIEAALNEGYTFLRVQGEDVTWENGTLPHGARLQIDNYGDSGSHTTTLTLSGSVAIQGELSVGYNTKLVIADSTTVTVSKGTDEQGAHMDNNGGIVENAGTIVLSEGCWLGGEGNYSGSGTITDDSGDPSGGSVSNGWKISIAEE